MKKAYRITILFFAALVFGGCINIMTRTECEMKPYACAPYTYYCTWECLKVLAIPFSDPIGPEGSIGKAYATVFFPVFLIGLPFDVALDTVFLPVDGIYALCKDKPKKSHGETEKTEEVR